MVKKSLFGLFRICRVFYLEYFWYMKTVGKEKYTSIKFFFLLKTLFKRCHPKRFFIRLRQIIFIPTHTKHHLVYVTQDHGRLSRYTIWKSIYPIICLSHRAPDQWILSLSNFKTSFGQNHTELPFPEIR